MCPFKTTLTTKMGTSMFSDFIDLLFSTTQWIATFVSIGGTKG